MEKENKYTVIVMHYNQNEYIKDAIKSVLEQDYKNIQLLVVDDFSAKFDKQEIKDYIKENAPEIDFDIIQNKRNYGTVKSVRKILKNIKGEFVSFVAADDMLFDKTAVSRNIKNMKKFDRQVLVTMTAMMDSSLNHTYKLIPEIDSEKFNLMSRDEQLKVLLQEEIFGAGAVIYKTKTLIENFNKVKTKLVEDWPLHINILISGNKFIIKNYVTLKHRDGGVSSKNAINKHVNNDIINIYAKIIFKNFKVLNKKEREFATKRYSYFLNNIKKYNLKKYIFLKILYKLKVLPKA